MQAPEVDGFFTRAAITDPLPFLAEARERYPVFRSPMADGEQGFVVTRYDDIKAVYANAADFSNAYAHVLRPPQEPDKGSRDEAAMGFDYNKYASFLLTEDDPVHAKRRDLVAAVFRARSVNDLTPAIYARCDRIIDSFIGQGEADLINDFAVPLALGTILQILGFGDELVGRAFDWSLAAAMRISHSGTPEQEREAAAHIAEMIAYLRQAVTDIRTGKPFDEGSIAYQVISARDGDDFLLDDDEAVSFLHELLFAGNETTRATIVAAIALVLRDPDQLALLQENRALLDNAVEETMRYHSTGAAIWRVAARDARIGDVEVPAGAVLNLRMDSANRDASVFEDPDRFDIARKGAKAHLGFGYGLHHCVGNLLAKRETLVALDRVTMRLKGLALVTDACDFAREPHVLAHAFKAVRIRFDPVH
jgi:cytochrome P450